MISNLFTHSYVDDYDDDDVGALHSTMPADIVIIVVIPSENHTSDLVTKFIVFKSREFFRLTNTANTQDVS